MLYQNNQQCRVIVKVKELPIGTPQVITTSEPSVSNRQ